MPVLKKIVVQDFRNIELQELEFSANVNCICGVNGSGKTNLLDAIYYLSMTKSALSTADKFNFRYDQQSFSISGIYDMPSGVQSRFSMKVEEGSEKKVRRDDKPYQKVADHIGILPVVIVSPSDISMVSESGDERRRFVNSVLSQMDAEYLASAQQYGRLLAQRNRLLKETDPDEELLSTFDLRMESCASIVYEGRRAFVEKLRPVVRKYYESISGGGETVDIEYKSDLTKCSLTESFRAHRERDRILKFTTSGIQRDDFLFTMDSYPIRRCGSQGQQKSFLVALKFAQYEIMRDRYGFPPVLLLDDLFDKLDMDRVSNLLRMVSGNDFGQIFITDSNKVRITGLLDGLTEDKAYFECVHGTFSRL